MTVYKKHPTENIYAGDDGHIYQHYDFGKVEWSMYPEHDDKRGYFKVNIDGSSAAWTRVAVHWLVYECWYGVRKGKDNGFVIDHVDEDKKNNKPENLREILETENVRRSRINSKDYDCAIIVVTEVDGTEWEWTEGIASLAGKLGILDRRIYGILKGDTDDDKGLKFRVKNA